MLAPYVFVWTHRYMIVSEARRIGTRFMLEPDEGVSFGDLKSIPILWWACVYGP